MHVTTRSAALALTFALVLIAARPAHAMLIVDQQNADTGTGGFTPLGTSSGSTNRGQGFTPALAAIDTVQLKISSEAAATYHLDLRAGDGLGGTLLGSTPALSVPVTPANIDTTDPITFTFAAPIALAPGSRYTFQLVKETGADAAMYFSASVSNRYAAGTEYIPGYGAEAFTDFQFAEGIAVPEPTTLAAVAGLGMIAARRRRR